MELSTISGRVALGGYHLSDPLPACGLSTSWIRVGNLVVIAGQGPTVDGQLKYVGKIGADLSVAQGRLAAELCALNILAQLAAACGDQVARVEAVKLSGVINCTDNFSEQDEIMDAASELIIRILGTRGYHTRSAAGTNALASQMAMQVEAIFQVYG